MPEHRGIIAIVDDDAGIRKALARLLRASHFETHVFGSAEEFLDRAALERHDCLILDIRLPGISGLELSRRLEEQNMQLPTIFITAQEKNWASRQTGIPDVNVCRLKPVPAATLLGAVESALSRASRQT